MGNQTMMGCCFNDRDEEDKFDTVPDRKNVKQFKIAKKKKDPNASSDGSDIEEGKNMEKFEALSTDKEGMSACEDGKTGITPRQSKNRLA
jgi:hypothetical protein